MILNKLYFYCCGKIFLKEACIIANRHIHVTKEEKQKYGWKEEVSVLIEGKKGGIMHHVYLKESEKSYFEMHIDTDDANAFCIENEEEVTIIDC